MKALFVGTALPPTTLNEYIDNKSIVDIPAYVLGWNFVYGLSLNDVTVYVLNDLKTPFFPKHKKLYANKIDFKTNNITFYPLTKININLIEKLSKTIRFYISMRKIKSKFDCILVYSLHTPYLIPALKYAKKNNIPVITIVPDLPIYMGRQYSGIKKMFKEYDIRLLKRIEHKVDGYILLTKHMMNQINSDAPSLVIEGIANTDGYKYTENENNDNYILYSGNLSKAYGLPEFVEAYLKSNVDAEFWICGDGDFKDEIINYSKKYNKIKYLGVINREEVMRLQQQAQLLINPRNKEDNYTLYSFPSKTIEYLLSGTPLMMEKLQGIPEEYYNYIIEVDDDWISSLQSFFNLDKTKRKDIGIKGRQFILDNKNYLTQGEKVKRFIEVICIEREKDS